VLIVDGSFSAEASQKLRLSGNGQSSADHREQALMAVEMVVGQELLDAGSAASKLAVAAAPGGHRLAAVARGAVILSGDEDVHPSADWLSPRTTTTSSPL